MIQTSPGPRSFLLISCIKLIGSSACTRTALRSFWKRRKGHSAYSVPTTKRIIRWSAFKLSIQLHLRDKYKFFCTFLNFLFKHQATTHSLPDKRAYHLEEFVFFRFGREHGRERVSTLFIEYRVHERAVFCQYTDTGGYPVHIIVSNWLHKRRL
jgi:hypothetical protein